MTKRIGQLLARQGRQLKSKQQRMGHCRLQPSSLRTGALRSLTPQEGERIEFVNSYFRWKRWPSFNDPHAWLNWTLCCLLGGIVLIGLPATTGGAENSLFGDWDFVEVNKVHEAKHDGFLTAFSHGSGGARFFVLTGESKDKLRARSRGNHFDGATIPVKEGHYYKVEFYDDKSTSRDSPNNISAYWLPITGNSSR